MGPSQLCGRTRREHCRCDGRRVDARARGPHRNQAPRTKGRPMNPTLLSSVDMDWETPPGLIADLEREFGPFDLDVAAAPHNAKAPKYFTEEDDGLTQDWYGLCFMNPPYGREIGKWVAKARAEAEAGRATVVALIPARTDTSYWHEHIFDVADLVMFLKGRVRFTRDGQTGPAPFPSA